TQSGLLKVLRKADLTFPAMHGAFGEDGEIQGILEKAGIPYIGSSKNACELCFDKYEANKLITDQGFFTLPSMLLKRGQKDISKNIKKFFKENKIKRAIVKPTATGSSIGVNSVTTPKQAELAARSLFNKGGFKRIVIEPFCEGVEFTAVILQNKFGLPTCLLPVEIEVSYDQNQVFDYRKKYLPTHQVGYRCPPSFDDQIITKIRRQAEQLFAFFGMKDVARFDGWVLPDGNIWFSDFNPVSGMEQNSFLFLQAARLGFSHRDVLRYIVENACRRIGIDWQTPVENPVRIKKKKQINIIFGGNTAERQVSVMSGTNVWLKLKTSEKYDPHPYLLDIHGSVWKIPYAYALHHTVEEITEVCKEARKNFIQNERLKNIVLEDLAPRPEQLSEEVFVPEKMSFQDFVKKSKYVFLGLHGGPGENGEFQEILTKAKVPYNGPRPEASRLGMDKYKTGLIASRLGDYGIYSAKRLLYSTQEIRSKSREDYQKWWKDIISELGSKTVIVKPRGDGCSAGILRLYNAKDLKNYVYILLKGDARIPANILSNQPEIVEMPPKFEGGLLFEEFIASDHVQVLDNKLSWKHVTGWIEITVGVFGEKNKMKAMNPSITVAQSSVLSVEEKFQGGTGVNITPPPEKYVPKNIVTKARRKIEIFAKEMGLSGYSRIDAFLDIKSGEVIIIEANTLPGLTPSTVIYHQALAERPSMYPRDFLEKIIESSQMRGDSKSWLSVLKSNGKSPPVKSNEYRPEQRAKVLK
ncbi:MAG: hypothetical protein KDD56_09115, partial [Bdellovibrionales bacterium]|nr:hypothetical protein [Bdellovibrionales bacterium]